MKLKEKMHQCRVAVKECGELTDRTIFINRVAKVVKGGRRFSFSALVVTGDGMGHVGYGTGKAGEVPEAIRKASEAARRNIVKVPMRGSTIPHDYVSDIGPTRVILKPAKPGTGVIAGSVVRSVAELAGIQDISTKCIGSNNPNNILRSTFAGFVSMKDPDQVARVRGINLEEVGYSAY